MYNNDFSQFAIFFYSIGFGAILSFLYDLIKHTLIRSSKFLIIIDFFYGIFFSILTFLFLLALNFGQLRLFIVCGFILGFIIWNFFISQFFVIVLLRFKNLITDLFYCIGNLLSSPFKLFLKITRKLREKHIKCSKKI